MTESNSAIIVAALANLAIAATKFAAAAVTRSAAMLSEGIHSMSDTADQLLVLYGKRRARKLPDEEHPFGYAGPPGSSLDGTAPRRHIPASVTARRTAQRSKSDVAEFGPAIRFLRALWELNHALESASRSMKKRFGVTGPERLFLRIVGQRPGITPAEVAETLHVDRSSVTPLIKKLERRRLVTRSVNPADGRSFHLFLTAMGQRIDAMRSGTVESAVDASLERAGRADAETTAAMLTGVAERLRAAFAEDAPPRVRAADRRRRRTRTP